MKKSKPSEKERLRDRCESTSGIGNKCPEGFIKKHSGKIVGASLVIAGIAGIGIGLNAYIMSGTGGKPPTTRRAGDHSGNNTANKFLQLIDVNEEKNINFGDFKDWVNREKINLSEAYILWMNYAGPWWKIPEDARYLLRDPVPDVIDKEDYQHIKNEINDFINMDRNEDGIIDTTEYKGGQPMMRRTGDSPAEPARTPDAAGGEEYPSNKYWCNDYQAWRLMHRPRPGNLSNQLTFHNDGTTEGENRYPTLSTNGSGEYREMIESTVHPQRPPPSSLLERKGHAGDGRANYWRDGETTQEPEWVSKKKGTDCIPNKVFSEENKGECCVGASRKKYLQDHYQTKDQLREGMKKLDDIYSYIGVRKTSPQYDAVNKMMTEDHDVSIDKLIDKVLEVEGTDGEIGDPNIEYRDLPGPDTYWEKIAGEPEQPRDTPPPWVPPNDWMEEFPSEARSWG